MRARPTPRPHGPRAVLTVVAMTLGLTLVACTAPVPTDADLVDATPSPTPTPTPTPDPVSAEVRPPDATHTVLDTLEPYALASQTAGAFFASAPVVVVAPQSDQAAVVRAASAAVALGVPVLLTPPDGTDDGGLLADEVARLEAEAVLTFGDATVELPSEVDVVQAPADDDALAELLGSDLTTTAVAPGSELAQVVALDRSAPTLLAVATEAPAEPAPTEPAPPESTPTDASTAVPGTSPAPTEEAAEEEEEKENAPSATGELPLTELGDPIEGAALLTTGAPEEIAPVATARAAGADVVVVPSADPRTTSETVQAVAAAAPTHVVALGAGFGSAEELAWKVATAATGVELPGGGQVLFPGRRFVALYGNPETAALGLLGEQGLTASISRAQGLAAEYQALTDDVVVPAFEIIVTVASAGAGDDGNYSNEKAAADFIPWIEAARDAGVYVVLDLQPGRTDFLTQAKLYEELLTYPNVGLALDPEWRLKPDQVHLRQIGSVDVAEVNAVADWLATLTRENALPQKLLILHQFRLSMIKGRESVTTTHPELAVLLHVDGQGSQGAKAGTWAALQQGAPAGVHWGWKNFIDEDIPMATPEQTYRITPVPAFVSYQ